MHTSDQALHPFDQAMQLEAAGSDQPDTWHGATSPAYWNMVGPFGGTTAATALQAVLKHPLLLGEAAGGFSVMARPVRTNRSTQHWTVELTQAGASGDAAVVMTATAVTAVRRSTWSANDSAMPVAGFDDAAPRMTFSTSEWSQRYDMRVARGFIPQVWDGLEGEGEAASLSQVWIRDDPPRPLDFAALAAMADAFYPRVWLRRAHRVPAGTVSITTYFHAGSQQLAAVGQGYVFGQARAQAFHNGFFDQTAQVWDEAGHLLATSHQMVYYKN
jgi:acyl-CoA thioesterase